MNYSAEVVRGFPSTRIRSSSGGLPVEVFLIAQLGHGAGDRLHAQATQLQRGHAGFIDALDEPSVRLAAPDFERGDPSALYTFAVGAGGHPFHRHAGHRVFTAISGSGGAMLRFSTATDADIVRDPDAFMASLHQIRVPADCMFSVRFGDGAWHQFAPAMPGTHHPVLFALSCHTNELGGPLDDAERARILRGDANLATLTEVLPPVIAARLHALDDIHVPTIALTFEAPEGHVLQRACSTVRRIMGRARSALSRVRASTGFVSGRRARVHASATTPADSLLCEHLREHHHEDAFSITLRGESLSKLHASSLLADVLDGFLEQRPGGVTALMRIRNTLVRPLRLRTSPLGCPVSSLLSPQRDRLFEGRFPVLDQRVDGRAFAQVVLGADDRHLRFRSCVAVRIVNDTRVEIRLGTRVHCHNAFGRAYMALISAVHRRYVSPAMLRSAVEHAFQRNAACPVMDGLFA